MQGRELNGSWLEKKKTKNTFLEQLGRSECELSIK